MNGTSAASVVRTNAENMNQETPVRVQLCDPATWVDKHGDCLFRYALSYVRDIQTAEDLVQETFLAALNSQGRFSGGSSERTWLVGILKHKVIDHYRAAKRQSMIAELVDASNTDPPGDEPASPENSGRSGGRSHAESSIGEWHINPSMCTQQKAFWDVLHQCLSKVSPRLASAFVLKEVEQLETKELCESLNISEGNLWVMLHRARTHLRQCLEANWLNKVA